MNNTFLNEWQQLLRQILDIPLENTMFFLKQEPTPQNKYIVWQTMLNKAKYMLETSRGTDEGKQMIQSFRRRFPSYRNQNEDEIIKYIFNTLDYFGNQPNKSQYFKLPIEGIRIVTIYFTHTPRSQQLLLLMGEQHDSPVNNAKEIIQTLVNELDCPIDIIVERPYVSNNLISYFTTKPITNCFIKGNNPKQEFLSSNTDYYKSCVEPYKGKVKMWEIDMQQMSWFNWFLFIRYNNEQQIKKDKSLMTMTKQFFLNILNYDAYVTNPTYYDNTIQEQYNTIFDYFSKKYTISDKDQFIKRFRTQKEKDYMKLMESLSYLTYESAKYICDKIRTECEKTFDIVAFVRYLSDAYAFMKICRIIREDKNRMIVCFVGEQHIYMLNDFFTNCLLSYKTDTTAFPYLEKIGETMYKETSRTTLVLKKLPPDRTQRMIYYQKVQI